MVLGYECRVLDGRGNTFVLNCLRSGSHLARSIWADARHAALGHALAFIPSVAPDDRNYSFDDGLAVGPTGGGMDALAELLLHFTRKDSSLVVIGESVNSRPWDPSLEEWSIPKLIAGDEVYPLVLASSVTRARLVELIDYLDGLQGSCIFVAGGLPELSGPARLEASPTVLERVAQTVELVVVTAYDGEGFVIWSSQLASVDWVLANWPTPEGGPDSH